MGYLVLLRVFIVSSVSMSLCFSVSPSLRISVSPYISPLPNLTLNMPDCLPALLSLYDPSLFPNKKFPIDEAHFWLDELFYIIDSIKQSNNYL